MLKDSMWWEQWGWPCLALFANSSNNKHFHQDKYLETQMLSTLYRHRHLLHSLSELILPCNLALFYSKSHHLYLLVAYPLVPVDYPFTALFSSPPTLEKRLTSTLPLFFPATVVAGLGLSLRAFRLTCPSSTPPLNFSTMAFGTSSCPCQAHHRWKNTSHWCSRRLFLLLALHS